MSIPQSYVSLPLILVLLAGCTRSDTSSRANRPEPYVRVEGAGTAEMRALLDGIHAEAAASPMDYFHLNNIRARVLLARLKAAPEEEKLTFAYEYANELLYAGRSRAAILQLNQLIQKIGAHSITPSTKPLFDALAISYMRLAEQENCITNPSAKACILPISGSGLHANQEGSRRAIAIYERMLRRFRGDLQARWLLNIAYMTVGEYPHGVPPRWLVPGIEAKPSSAISQFHDIAMELGVDHVGLAGGVSLDDFNNDGHLDILTSSYGTQGPMKLYLSDGTGGFVDHTEAGGLTGLTGGLNTVHADYDNDGYVDVFVLRGAWLGEAGAHPNSLLRNNGDGTFEDLTLQTGLLSYHPTQTASWGDFNNDGWIDLFVGNESEQELNALTGSIREGGASHPSELFVNNGDGTFTEVSRQVGLDVRAYVKAAVWGDVDNDGLQDLYLSIMGGPNRLYVNEGGSGLEDWRFTERAAEAGIQEPFFSFPAWFWDFDNDGYLDLFVSSYDSRHFTRMGHDVAAEYLDLPIDVELPRAYRNNGDGTFSEVSRQLNLDKLMYTMGSNFGDLDNDGYLDFYVGTGGIDLFSLMPNRMFHNIGGRRFEEVTYEGGFGHIQKGHAIGFADLDNDGDQDIYAVMGGALEGDVFRNVLFENPGHGRNWITLLLEGRASNRAAIGARLELTVSSPRGEQRSIFATVSTGGSFGASSLQQEIGIGDAVRIDKIIVTWPNADRTSQTFRDVAINEVVRLVEGESAPTYLSRPPVPFRTSEIPRPHRHEVP